MGNLLQNIFIFFLSRKLAAKDLSVPSSSPPSQAAWELQNLPIPRHVVPWLATLLEPPSIPSNSDFIPSLLNHQVEIPSNTHPNFHQITKAEILKEGSQINWTLISGPRMRNNGPRLLNCSRWRFKKAGSCLIEFKFIASSSFQHPATKPPTPTLKNEKQHSKHNLHKQIPIFVSFRQLIYRIPSQMTLKHHIMGKTSSR